MVNHVSVLNCSMTSSKFTNFIYIPVPSPFCLVSKQVYGVRPHETVVPSGNDGMGSGNDGMESGNDGMESGNDGMGSGNDGMEQG